ncbi:ABC transporter permease [Bacillus tuaregi]|uniref:ABC transporter permease n=1 Tax=Bacillus tuaregi TaxID=1816695 RepID=UPI0008F83B6B|nr:ABC transporter permease [Bacillus tuaregi]
MSSLAFLFNRLLQDFRFQSKVIKMVMDWTVMLYMTIPAVFMAGFTYRSWWIELPDWSEFVVLPGLASIVFIVSWSSQYRSFVKEADEVFLLKYKQKYFQLKKWAYGYSFIKNVVSILLAVLLVLPFLSHKYSFSITEVFCFMLLFIGFSSFIMSIKMIFSMYLQGWLEKLLLTLLFLFFLAATLLSFSQYVYMPAYLIGIALIFIVISFFLSYRRLHTTKYFYQEVAKENEEFMRYVQLVFGAAPELEKPKIIKRTRPLLFPQSKRLFKRNLATFGFLELFFKVILRNSSYFGGYYKLFAVTALAIILIPPLYLKLILLLGFWYFIWIWAGHVWDKVILTNPIGRQYENHDAFFSARKQACLVLTLPAICLLSVILIVNLF